MRIVSSKTKCPKCYNAEIFLGWQIEGSPQPVEHDPTPVIDLTEGNILVVPADDPHLGKVLLLNFDGTSCTCHSRPRCLRRKLCLSSLHQKGRTFQALPKNRCLYEACGSASSLARTSFSLARAALSLNTCSSSTCSAWYISLGRTSNRRSGCCFCVLWWYGCRIVFAILLLGLNRYRALSFFSEISCLIVADWLTVHKEVYP